jgi:hypothetical protein
VLIGAASQRSNQLRNNEFFKIHVKHIPTGRRISFEGFVTQFSDTYTAQWNEEQVYGRMDPLSTYQGTKRNITLGFDIPADSKQMATMNMSKIQNLIQFMYPVYDSGDLSTQNVLAAAPLLTLKWTNLISSVNNEGQELVGYINGPISYAPDVSAGGFMDGAIAQHATKAGQSVNGEQVRIGGEQERIFAIRNYFPKKISMNFNFTVLHTHLLGWSPTGVVDNWDGQPAAVVEHAKLHNMPSRNQTTSYSFGGSTEVASRFPNIYNAPPAPAPLPQPDPPAPDAPEDPWMAEIEAFQAEEAEAERQRRQLDLEASVQELLNAQEDASIDWDSTTETKMAEFMR